MRRSTERILTTHVGSLPRPPELIEMMVAEDRGGAVDRSVYEDRLKRAVDPIVARQVELGVRQCRVSAKFAAMADGARIASDRLWS